MRKYHFIYSLLVAFCLLHTPSSASATWVDADCFSGSYGALPGGGVSPLVPTTWCEMAWGPGGAYVATDYSLYATFAALAYPGVTAAGTRSCYGACQSSASGSLGPIIITCSKITSAIDAHASAIGYWYSPALGYLPVTVDIADYVGSVVPNSPPVAGCSPIL